MSLIEETNEAIIGKPILLRPSVKLRRQLDDEAESQKRSLNNLVIVILEKYFKPREPKLPLAR